MSKPQTIGSLTQWLQDLGADPELLARYVTWNTGNQLFNQAFEAGKVFVLANRSVWLAQTYPELNPPTLNGRFWMNYDRVVFIRLLDLLIAHCDAPDSQLGAAMATTLRDCKMTTMARFPDLDFYLERNPIATKSVSALDRPVAGDAFDLFMAKHNLTATQKTFVRVVRQVSRSNPVTLSRLGQPPFTSIGDFTILFTSDQRVELMAIANALPAHPKVIAFPAPQDPPDYRRVRIVYQPLSKTVRHGGQAHFYVNYLGEGPVEIQWEFNGKPLYNEHSQTMWVNDVGYGDEGAYRVKLTNAHNSVTSDEARLTVRSALSAGEALANTHDRYNNHIRQGEFEDWRPGDGYYSRGSGYTYTTHAKTTPTMTCIDDDGQVSAIPAPPIVVARGKPAVQGVAAEAFADMYGGMD